MAEYSGPISAGRESPQQQTPSTLLMVPAPAPTPAPSSEPVVFCTDEPMNDPDDQQQLQVQPPPDGARKPRGRPPGSKNKPKPPVVITREADSAMKPIVLEISPGIDIIEAIISFVRRNQVSGITVVSACGTVANVTLRHPLSHLPIFSLRGPFSILSLTGSYVCSLPFCSGSDSLIRGPASCPSPRPSSSSCAMASPSWYSSFGITLSGSQGQVFGGVVGGKVVAATQVIVVATTFVNPSYHRMSPAIPDDDHGAGVDHYANDDVHHHQETKPGTGNHHGLGAAVGFGAGGGGGAAAAAGIGVSTGLADGSGDSCSSAAMSMSVYGASSSSPLNCHLGSPDGMPWCSTSRPPY